MMTSEKVDKILPALAKVKTKLQAVTKSANNPFFKSKYADLNTYLDEVEPLLETNGLVLLQPTCHDASGNTVVTRLYHVETGQYVESSMKLVGDTDMQKSGSGVTYARRYTLGALLSMKAEDDDGNTASGKTYNKPAAPKAAIPASQTTVAPTPAKPAAQAATQAPAAQQEAPAIQTPPANKPSFRDRYKAQKEAQTAKPAAAETEIVSNGDDL